MRRLNLLFLLIFSFLFLQESISLPQAAGAGESYESSFKNHPQYLFDSLVFLIAEAEIEEQLDEEIREISDSIVLHYYQDPDSLSSFDSVNVISIEDLSLAETILNSSKPTRAPPHPLRA